MRFTSPSGARITGTLERLSGYALLLDINDDGSLEYAGETEVDWDS